MQDPTVISWRKSTPPSNERSRHQGRINSAVTFAAGSMATNVGDIRQLTGTVNQARRYGNIAILVNRPYSS